MVAELPDGSKRIAAGLAVVAGAGLSGVTAWKSATGFLSGQARAAREVIPKPEGKVFDGDGVYRPGAHSGELWRPGLDYDLHMMVFGDSIAAGLGADSPAQLPGVLVARGLAEESGKSVRLSIKAIVGATSNGLEGQVEAMEIAGGKPDVAVILVGGNDITAQNNIARSARRLGQVVERLVATGSVVVVGTCPDLGTIVPIPQPLRSLLHTLSLRLAAAQKTQVLRAGGHPVSIAETIADEFRAEPERFFAYDRFHPNSAGYELAAGLLLPAVCEALGVWETPGEEPIGDDPLPEDAEPGEQRETVVGRLSERLQRFVREHPTEDTEGPGEAADTLRRRSRILRRVRRV